MARRYYSSTAAATSLSSGIGSGTTSITVGSVSGFPGSYPYTLIVDPDTVNEEVVSVTAGAGTTLTVTRGQDGTAAVAHSAAAVVKHGVSARDFDEANDHVNKSAGAHGVAGSLVGTTDTQALTNKTLTAPAIGGTSSHTGLMVNSGTIQGGTVDPTTLGVAWTAWTPTLGNVTGGDGVFRYKLLDAKTLLVRCVFTSGTVTSTFSNVSVSLPAGRIGDGGANFTQGWTSTLDAVLVKVFTSVFQFPPMSGGTSLIGYGFSGVFEVV